MVTSMFSRIFVEEHLLEHQQVKNIIQKFPNLPLKTLVKIEDVFGRVRKPYLQKRTDLQIFIGEKKGRLVKEAPPAYGSEGAPHYYFVHAYNCIYECNYCYLQGYFSSPDLVIYVNHDEVIKEIERIILTTPKKGPWFHAGEFSDSLALSHITGEIPLYYDFFSYYPQAFLEFRTKSVNIKEILKQDPLENIITSFSLSPKEKIKNNDLKTPSLNSRLSAIKRLHQAGHPIGIHFDPIIFEENYLDQYQSLINQLIDHIPPSKVKYISLGVVRFTKDVFHQVKQNYPDSEFLDSPLIKSFDGKIRYPKPMRNKILNDIKVLLLKNNFTEKQIYLCMEN